MTIYQDIILDHYRSPRNNKQIENPTGFSEVSNPLCGDEMCMQVHNENGTITDIGFTGTGCAISIASASMLTEYAKGKSNEDLKKLDKQNIIEMLGIELSPNRLKCALLSMEALKKALADTNSSIV